MKVLGISDGMTAGAALIENGKIVFAVHEERLIRQKMATGFPKESISLVLEATHTRPEEIQAVAVATVNEFFREQAVTYDGWLLREQAPLKEIMLTVSSHFSRFVGSSEFFKQSYYGIKGLLSASRRRRIVQLLQKHWDLNCPVEFINHHLLYW